MIPIELINLYGVAAGFVLIMLMILGHLERKAAERAAAKQQRMIQAAVEALIRKGSNKPLQALLDPKLPPSTDFSS